MQNPGTIEKELSEWWEDVLAIKKICFDPETSEEMKIELKQFLKETKTEIYKWIAEML